MHVRTSHILLAVPTMLFGLSQMAYARNYRNPEAKAEFRREHPCPSTGKTTGPCKGYVIDHRIPLCQGSKDEPGNMRWQTFDQSILKDRWECKPGWEKRLQECEANGCYAQ